MCIHVHDIVIVHVYTVNLYTMIIGKIIKYGYFIPDVVVNGSVWPAVLLLCRNTDAYTTSCISQTKNYEL